MNADRTGRGTLVIAYAHKGRGYETGGWTDADVAGLIPDLEAAGCTGIRVCDGIEAAREQFPAGTRVQAPRKYWQSQLGTVEPGRGGGARSVTRDGAQVRVRFDDGTVMTWPCAGLYPLSPGAVA